MPVQEPGGLPALLAQLPPLRHGAGGVAGGGGCDSGDVGEMGGLVTKVGEPRRQKLKNCFCPNCAVSRDTGQLGPPQVGQRTPN